MVKELCQPHTDSYESFLYAFAQFLSLCLFLCADYSQRGGMNMIFQLDFDRFATDLAHVLSLTQG